MNKIRDPRLDATRQHALDAALKLLEEQGALAVTHAAISTQTGISRSTLYRHWAKLEDLRYAAFSRAATVPKAGSSSNGPLKTDLLCMMGKLATALNETPWGKIAPQIIAAAATDQQSKDLLERWFEARKGGVKAVFDAAKERGEISESTPVDQLIETAIAIPYFRKLVTGQPLTQKWLEAHVAMICGMAGDIQD